MRSRSVNGRSIECVHASPKSHKGNGHRYGGVGDVFPSLSPLGVVGSSQPARAYGRDCVRTDSRSLRILLAAEASKPAAHPRRLRLVSAL